MLEFGTGRQFGLVRGVESLAESTTTGSAGFTQEIAADVFFSVLCDGDQSSFAYGVVFHGVVYDLVISGDVVDVLDDV